MDRDHFYRPISFNSSVCESVRQIDNVKLSVPWRAEPNISSGHKIPYFGLVVQYPELSLCSSLPGLGEGVATLTHFTGGIVGGMLGASFILVISLQFHVMYIPHFSKERRSKMNGINCDIVLTGPFVPKICCNILQFPEMVSLERSL
jgi:hypothetical protein